MGVFPWPGATPIGCSAGYFRKLWSSYTANGMDSEGESLPPLFLKKKKHPRASAHPPRIAAATPIPAFTPVDSSPDPLSVSVGVAGRGSAVVVIETGGVVIVAGGSEDVVDVMLFGGEEVVEVVLVVEEVELGDGLDIHELEVELGLDFGRIQK